MITPKQLAERAGLTPQHIRLLCRQGKIKAEKPQRDWFIPDEEAERFLREREAKQEDT